MVKTTIHYRGKLHCELTHEPSGSKIETDAPADNGGLGSKFSPTDLVGAALGSCILTTMAIVAAREKFDFTSARCEVEKEMTPLPRRIAKLAALVLMPQGLSADQRKKLESAAHTCPVHRSLHPEVHAPIEFHYQD